MRIEARSLTTCAVVKGGDQITLGLVDGNGAPVEIKVSTSDACAIAMTLPGLLRRSLEEKHRDENLRYVFPLRIWQVEASSDGALVILTLATDDGFEVSFSTRPDMCVSLGKALRASMAQQAAARLPIAN